MKRLGQVCLKQVGYQFFQDPKNQIILDHLKIVHHQQKPALQFQDIVDQDRTDDLIGGKLPGTQHALNLPAQVPVYLLQRGDEIGKKAPRIVIGGVQGKPRDRTV